MNPCKKTIGWADFTWNPLNGCKHGCSYCAAKVANQRWGFIPDWNNPIFFPERLKEPGKMKKAAVIFVVFMGDLFGDWVCKDWIKSVIMVCEDNPRHTFMFLTKNPKRYLDFDFPTNCMLGCTITGSESYREIILRTMLMKQLKRSHKNRVFVSIEPILGIPAQGLADYSIFDLVIIGAETGRKPVIPEREWVDSITHPNIYYKNNIIKYFPDLKNKTNELQGTKTN